LGGDGGRGGDADTLSTGGKAATGIGFGILPRVLRPRAVLAWAERAELLGWMEENRGKTRGAVVIPILENRLNQEALCSKRRDVM
jgi:hypothetical protein